MSADIDTHTELAEGVDSLGILFQERHLLKASHNPQLVFTLASGKIGMAAYDQKYVGFVLDQLLHARESIECLFKVRGGDGEIDRCNARLVY
jgi:hypothetical protein